MQSSPFPNTEFTIKPYIYIATDMREFEEMVRMINAHGGEVLSYETHEHFDYETYTIRSVLPTEVFI